MTKTAPAAKTFDNAISGLETIVRQLEAGNLPLEQALACYQRGVALLRCCQDKLDAAEQQVKMLEGDTLVRFAADDADKGEHT
ncbi:MAG: exodeoxyribonuclease VII small subunit [Azoarcus sp.]|jgi:exodeoxyribonuclease VII small subunit|nr:exodeoxyribonuclease VII small subunit [Azoarcus sp.]